MASEFTAYTPFTKDTQFADAAKDDTDYIGYIKGLAATNHKDRYGDVITDQALQKGSADLMSNTTVFKNHDYTVESAVGKVVESLFVSDGAVSGISVKVGISKAETALWTKIKEGILDSFSIGGIFKEVQYNKDKEVYEVKDLEIWELSIVGMPANPAAKFQRKGIDEIASMVAKQEEQKMTDNTDTGKLAALEDRITLLSKSVEALAAAKSAPADAQGNEKLLATLDRLEKNIAPIVAEQQQKKEMAERRSKMIADEKARIDSMPYTKKLRLEMRKIIETVQDPAVRVTELIADNEYQPPIHKRDLQELREEMQRIGVS